MAEYSVDYIKEKAKANYELIKILSLLTVTIGAATITLLRGADFSDGFLDVDPSIMIWVVSGVATVISLVGVILFYIVDTNALLRKLNEPQSEDQ